MNSFDDFFLGNRHELGFAYAQNELYGLEFKGWYWTSEPIGKEHSWWVFLNNNTIESSRNSAELAVRAFRKEPK